MNVFLTSLQGAGEANQGVFLSPLSIVYALTLALNGAGPASATHAELFKALTASAGAVGAGVPAAQPAPSEAEFNSELGKVMALLTEACSDGVEQPKVVLANSIWTRNLQLAPAYAESMQAVFKATAREATNGAADVNTWVAQVTQGMIKSLISTDNFAAILANAIYFKGLWKTAFKPQLTKARGFTTAADGVQQVPMMMNTFEAREGILGAHVEGEYDAVALPYKGGTFSALALLPAHGKSAEHALRLWASGAQALTPVGRLMVVLPKFKVSSSMSLKPTLEAMGVKAAFSGAADFSRMASGTLFVSDVVHKAVVEVDEEGTVAAAATAVMMVRSMPLPAQELIFDRPFAFIIRHDATQLPAFVGIVNDPRSSN